jgi:hypothetical protein
MRTHRRRRLTAMVIAALSALTLLAACRSGTRGQHQVPSVHGLVGSYTALFDPSASDADIENLRAQVDNLAAASLETMSIGVGVMVVQLGRRSSPGVSRMVRAALAASSVVDDVLVGGCDQNYSACERWSTRALTPRG